MDILPYANKPQSFSTTNGSYYVVAKNGTVRAKVSTGEIFSRPYNIYFLDKEGIDLYCNRYVPIKINPDSSHCEAKVFWRKANPVDSENPIIETTIAKFTPSSTHRRPFEMHPNCSKFSHIGHEVDCSIDASDEIKTKAASFLNEAGDEITKFCVGKIKSEMERCCIVS